MKLDRGQLNIELRGARGLERFEVREFTPDWIAVEITGGWPAQDRGLAATLEIIGPGGFVEQLRCELVFGGWLAVSGRLSDDGGDGAGDKAGEKAGVARLLLSCEGHERTDLVRAYRQLRFPALFERGELDADRVVELFERSGYIGLRGEAERPSAAWCDPEFPADLSVDAVYCAEDGALLGHVSVTRAYSRTWLGHQLTTFNDHPESTACRVALYNHFATVPILIDGHEEQYLLGYYDRSKPWHQLFFDSFIDWYDEPDRATIVPFDRYEVLDPTAGMVANDDPKLELDQPRPAELEQAVALIREQLPPLACAAFDIEAGLLDRAYLHPDFASTGIARGRRVFVVREAGELVGVALCESGSEELNLFNLFNLVQLYFRPRASSAAKMALVTFVRRHYRSIGRSLGRADGEAQPLIVAPAGSLSEPAEAGLALAETMGCIIWSGHTLRAYKTFLRRAFKQVAERSPEPRAVPYPRVESQYSPRLEGSRARLREDERLVALSRGELDPLELLGFLLNFAALGVRTLEGVESWISRAGQACAGSGREQLGAELIAAANGEAERDRLLLDDLFELGARWRDEHGARINVELLLHQPPPRSVLRYVELREQAVTGERPWTQIAMQYEIETMFATVGPPVLQACARTLGEELHLSFLDDELARDGDSSRARLERLLSEDPELAEPLAGAGCAALDAYLDFLGDCVDLGCELARRARAPANQAPARARAGSYRLAFA